MTARATPLLIVLLLGTLCAAVATVAPEAHLDWNRGSGAQSKERVADLARRLPDPIRITHYVSSREDLPATHSALPDAIRESLATLFADVSAADLLSADPNRHPEWADFLNAAGVRQTRARSVERDGWTEARLWSSVRIESGPGPAAVWNGVGPADLPLLAPWVIGRLEQLHAPRKPRIGVDAPAAFGLLRARLAEAGEVRDADVAGGNLDDLDVLFWVDPGPVAAEQLARIDAFRDAGGSVVLAGSAWVAAESEAGGAPQLDLAQSDFRAADVFAHFGLTADAAPVFDARFVGDERPGAIARPHRVRCIAPNQDFRELDGQPNGDLPFFAPTSLRLDPEALEMRGLRGTVIASTGSNSWAPLAAAGTRSQAEWNALPRRPNAHAPLAVFLQPEDAWTGSVAIFGASSPFDDAALAERDAAPTRLTSTLVKTLASDERLVRRGLAGDRPAPLPELPPRTRLAWRTLVIGAIPLLLAIATLALRRKSSRGSRVVRPWVPLAATLLVLAFLVPQLAARGVQLVGSRVPDSTREVFTRLAPPSEVRVQFMTLFSFASDLPPELRGPAAQAEEWCRELAAEVPGLRYDALRSAREGAVPGGVELEPLSFSSTLDERTTLRRVYSHLLIDNGRGLTAIPLESAEAIAELPFRLALAIERLQTRRPRTLAVLANAPRLSPAEVELLYARRGLHAPRGVDAYGTALDQLRAAGFEFEWIDRDAPRIPESADAVLWLQPRRDTLPMSVALSEHLARGGRALVAGQHHRVIARQLDDASGELRFWPQPQFCDLDQGYLPELGARLEREVLCDPLFAALDVSTQVETSVGSELRVQSSAQPFFVRVPAANRKADFAGTTDLLLPGGNRWSVAPDRLARHGLTVRVLASSSAQAWSYAWKGGDLPVAALNGASGEPGVQVLGTRAPLALELTGPFPSARLELERTADGRERGRIVVDEPTGGEHGRLVLLGGSEGFTDDYVRAAGSRGDRALLAIAADLALPADLAGLLPQDSRARGFDYVAPNARLWWRALVVGLVPALLLLLALLGKARA